MTQDKKSSFNGLVYKKAYKRLKLTSTERVIFQRLLGFLIRNDKPFPYSAPAMAELTGINKRTIFRALNRLEYLRLIERVGEGANRRFKRGSILRKILTTATYSSNKVQVNNSTTATLCHKNLYNRDMVSQNKTSFSLKLKDQGQKILKEENPDCLNSEHVSNKPVTQQEVDSLTKLIATEEEYLQSMTAWKPSPTFDRATIDRVIGNTTIKIAELKARLSQYQ